MKNFTDKDIQDIKSFAENNIKLLDKGISWTENNLKYEEKSNILLKIKNSKNLLQRIKNSIEDKPVIAVFGASQVGKSYLIKNLLSTENTPFEIINDEVKYDFLEEINPPGTGAESTGVVTRFTIDKPISNIEFPIEIKLHSIKDVLIILIDTFYLDLKRIKTPFNTSQIDEQLKVFESNYEISIQNHLTEFDVLEIKSYIENHLEKYSLLFEAMNSIYFFERLGKIIDGFSGNQWDDLFSVLWSKNKSLSKLFNLFIENIGSFSFKEKAFIPFEAVLRGQHEILDVKRLKEIYDSNKEITILKENGDKVNVKLGVLAALTKELVFSVPDSLVHDKPFLEKSDLLDFPGARSRLSLEYEDINEDVISDMFLRGKVSYLFNKYTDECNINNLLFCTNDKLLDVNELPSILENWIHKNIGSTIQQRSETLKDIDCPPLFLIYTFFNNQLKYDLTNDINFKENPQSLNYKWDTRFKRFFKNEIVTQSRNWDINWIKDKHVFNNMYILRDFKYSNDTFEGFELNKKEVNLRAEREDFIKELRTSFINYDFVKEHFVNPELTWEEATEVNKNGSQTIINNLNKVSSNHAKINYYIGKINELISEIKNSLSKYAHIEDIEKRRETLMHQVNSFQFSFNPLLIKDTFSFEKFIEKLSLKPEDLFNLLNQNIVIDASNNTDNQLNEDNIILTTYPELQNASTYDDAIEILKNELWLETKEDVEKFLNSKGINLERIFIRQKPKSKSEIYISILLNDWKERISNKEEFNYFATNNILFSDIMVVTSHLEQIMTTRKIEEHLVKIIDDVVSEVELNQGIEDFIAEMVSAAINDVVINFDMNYIDSETMLEVNDQSILSMNRFFSSKKADIEYNELDKLFDQDKYKDSKLIMLQKYNKWIESLRTSMLINCGFAKYDIRANTELLNLISDLNVLNVSNND
jgi:hypothetical protein